MEIQIKSELSVKFMQMQLSEMNHGGFTNQKGDLDMP